MLAELAAANAAFAVIKQAVQNGRELADAGSAITKYVGAKEELSRRAKKRKNRALLIVTRGVHGPRKAQAARRAIKRNYDLVGPTRLWKDWQAFRTARKSRRVQEALAKKRREELYRLHDFYGIVPERVLD